MFANMATECRITNYYNEVLSYTHFVRLIILCCLVLALYHQRKTGNSPGSDPASVSMTALSEPLFGFSWGFLSTVRSSPCFHKAFLVRKRILRRKGEFKEISVMR